jgi:hypothetical protein
MESLIEKAGFEVDITREECVTKRTQFYKCVVEKKNELTSTIAKDQWKNYNNNVNKIQFDCFAAKGLKKCEAFFMLTDYKY